MSTTGAAAATETAGETAGQDVGDTAAQAVGEPAGETAGQERRGSASEAVAAAEEAPPLETDEIAGGPPAAGVPSHEILPEENLP